MDDFKGLNDLIDDECNREDQDEQAQVCDQCENIYGPCSESKRNLLQKPGGAGGS